MANTVPALFAGITRKRWTGVALIWFIIALLMFFVYTSAKRSIMGEIRSHVMGVAIALSAGIDTDDLEDVHGPDDITRDSFKRVQQLMNRALKANRDIRYAYVMRRDRRPEASEADYIYVVDGSAEDANKNGVIDPDEISEDPGNPYDASTFPEMVNAWNRPTADHEITPDPPYPDLISGYAPIRDDEGRTVAIVGVDMTAPTIRSKLLAINVTTGGTGVVFVILVTLVALLYYQQREALARIKLLSEEVGSRNEMLRAANVELTTHNNRMRQEMKLAEQVQQGFLPTAFPRQDRVAFDKFYVTCEVLGGDLFDVFSLGEDHVGLYMADVAGHGVSAALISGLLKMAVSTVRDKNMIATGHLSADMVQPQQVLATLNDMLVKEIPDYEFITMVYAVLDLSEDTLVMASAGHPPPLFFNHHSGKVEKWAVPTGPALGVLEHQEYPLTEKAVREGDKVIFYTDGIVKAMNGEREEFGNDRLLEVVQRMGAQEPAEILKSVHGALDRFRGGSEISDDFSMLITELK